MHRNREFIAACLSDFRFNHIYDKSAETLPQEYAATHPNCWLVGGTEHINAEEYGVKYHIDPVNGQKTGFFLDQRENRHLLSAFSSGATVLNTFCYTGGFSLMALKAGAEKVVSVDVSAKALQTLEQNLDLNGLRSEKHISIKQDAKEYLKECEEKFDVIVLDPPAYAKHMGARHKAVQAYRRLNESGMRLLKPGGYLFTFSCSQVVEASLFHGAVTAAAIDCRRKTRILNYLSQGPDHPVSIFHPEGRYLKGLLLQMD
jgi:23S rRNA (cytosine1962-C5)-methyltransferase